MEFNCLSVCHHSKEKARDLFHLILRRHEEIITDNDKSLRTFFSNRRYPGGRGFWTLLSCDLTNNGRLFMPIYLSCHLLFVEQYRRKANSLESKRSYLKGQLNLRLNAKNNLGSISWHQGHHLTFSAGKRLQVEFFCLDHVFSRKQLTSL